MVGNLVLGCCYFSEVDRVFDDRLEFALALFEVADGNAKVGTILIELCNLVDQSVDVAETAIGLSFDYGKLVGQHCATTVALRYQFFAIGNVFALAIADFVGDDPAFHRLARARVFEHGHDVIVLANERLHGELGDCGVVQANLCGESLLFLHFKAVGACDVVVLAL